MAKRAQRFGGERIHDDCGLGIDVVFEFSKISIQRPIIAISLAITMVVCLTFYACLT